MKDNISLTLPLDPVTLKNASIMLGNMARELDPGVFKGEVVNLVGTVEQRGSTPETEVTTENLNITDPVVEEPEPAAPEVFKEVAATPPPPAEPAPQSDFIDTDARGMAWDKRIHAGTKTKLANGNWKNKRGVHYQELEDVETELMGGVTVPETTPDDAPTPTPTPDTTATVSTFPELMAAITGNSMAPDAVLAAVKSVGLESLPLLAARPDLVPAVAKELGV